MVSVTKHMIYQIIIFYGFGKSFYLIGKDVTKTS